MRGEHAASSVVARVSVGGRLVKVSTYEGVGLLDEAQVSRNGAEPASFRGQLRWLRLRAGSTQELLAERAGLSVATIGALEQGRRQPHAHTVAALAAALGLPPDEQASLLELAIDGLAASDSPGVPPPATHTSSAARERSVLPIPATALIARDAEIGAATVLLKPEHPTVRLMTLVGPGGVGKTRLALAVAAALERRYRDGASFVDLAPVHDPAGVPQTIARALHIPESGSHNAWERVQLHLCDLQLMLVLDNFEQLLPAAPLLAELLEACPRIALLVTSRTALRLRFEQRFVVRPLPAPGHDLSSAEAIATSASVRLFVDRASAVAPDFVLDQGSAPAVAEICRRLEGMPLAIELAAARSNVLRPRELLQRLERRLPLLTGGATDMPERQRTLRQTLAWSHCLLGPVAQVLFRRLAVFASSWTLAAAEAVCGGGDLAPDDVLEPLTELINNSLVYRTPGADARSRFGMLETVREYAAERLAECAENEATRRRHALFYLELAEAAVPELRGPNLAVWLERMEYERDNLRAALDFLSQQTDLDGALRLATAAAWYWLRRGYFTDAQQLLALLRRTGTQRGAVRAAALLAAARLASKQGDYGAQARLNAESLELFRELGDTAGAAEAMTDLGVAMWQQGCLGEAEACLERGLPQFRSLRDSIGIATAVLPLASVARDRGSFEAARGLYTEALARTRADGDRLLEGHVLNNMAWLGLYAGDLALARQLATESLVIRRAFNARREASVCETLLGKIAVAAGEPALARQLLTDSLGVHRELGNRWGVALTLEGVAGLVAASEPERALRLAGAAESVRVAIGRPRPPAEQPLLAAALAPARQAIPDALAGQAWADGRALAEEDAAAEALHVLATLPSWPHRSPSVSSSQSNMRCSTSVLAIGSQ
jgi:predicted ATPase/DNA-binding XRE family transcriptional regulator